MHANIPLCIIAPQIDMNSKGAWAVWGGGVQGEEGQGLAEGGSRIQGAWRLQLLSGGKL